MSCATAVHVIVLLSLASACRPFHIRTLLLRERLRDLFVLRPVEQNHVERRLSQRTSRLPQHSRLEASAGEENCAGVLRRPPATQLVDQSALRLHH